MLAEFVFNLHFKILEKNIFSLKIRRCGDKLSLNTLFVEISWDFFFNLTYGTISDQNSVKVLFCNKTKICEYTWRRFTDTKSAHQHLSDEISMTPIRFVSSWSSKAPLAEVTLSRSNKLQRKRKRKPKLTTQLQSDRYSGEQKTQK